MKSNGRRASDRAPYAVAMQAPDRSSDAVAAEPQWLTADEQQAWVALLGLMIKLPGVLDAQLQRDSELSLFEYFVLSSLSVPPDRTRRMSELANIVNGSLSRLSNVVKRLEQRGWVRREPCPGDGRITHAILTDTGWDHPVEAAPGHVRSVRRVLFDPLCPQEIETMRAISERIVERMDPQSRWP
jgi:DNA-binding MarR family transcriptional regulator